MKFIYVFTLVLVAYIQADDEGKYYYRKLNILPFKTFFKANLYYFKILTVMNKPCGIRCMTGFFLDFDEDGKCFCQQCPSTDCCKNFPNGLAIDEKGCSICECNEPPTTKKSNLSS